MDSLRGKNAHHPQASTRRLANFVLPDLRPAVCASLLLFNGWALVYLVNEPGYTPQAVSLSSYARGLVALLCFHELGALFRWAPPLVLLFDVTVLILATALSIYRALSGFYIDYYVIALNIGLIKYGESFSAVPAGAVPMLIGALLIAAVFAFTCRKALQRIHVWCWSPWWAALLRAAAAALLLHSLVHGHGRVLDGATELLRTMVREDPASGITVDPFHLQSLGIQWNETFPLLRPGPVPAIRCGSDDAAAAAAAVATVALPLAGAAGAETTTCAGEGSDNEGAGQDTTPLPLPHVVVLVLESFSAAMLHRRCTDCPSGAPITPNMNAFHDDPSHAHGRGFYGNSIQTARGQIAMLCGSLPSWRDKIFTAHPDLPLRCLPRVLGEVGYRSTFWSSQEDVSFDNTGAAMTGMVGFHEVKAMRGGLASASSPAKHWGMGWQDDESYRAFFAQLDITIAAEAAKPEGQRRPTFSVVASVSHHMHFDHLPQSERRLYPDAPAYAMRRNHEDSLHAADRYFGAFLAEMRARPALWERALLVVTSDHSYPNGEHANLYSDNSAYEENFRVPLVLRWGSSGKEGAGSGGRLRLRPGPLPVRGGSQVDLAPTILDLIGVRSGHHWWGESLVRPRPLPAQPQAEQGHGAGLLPYELPEEVRQSSGLANGAVAPAAGLGQLSGSGSGSGIAAAGSGFIRGSGSGLQRLLPKYRQPAAAGQAGTRAVAIPTVVDEPPSQRLWRRPLRPTILVQPYSGVYFCSVRWPWKLRLDWQSKAHVLIHLEADPHEDVNLFGHPALAAVQATLLADLAIPVASQTLIESKRLWPAAGPGAGSGSA